MISKQINLPLTQQQINKMRSGEKYLLNGAIITARDMAHKRMSDMLTRSQPLPFTLSKYCIYYCGPTPSKSGFPIGACGPTTSNRMDSFTDVLFQNGLKCMIGKGDRSVEVSNLLIKYKGVYLIAIGGAGALYGKSVLKSQCVAWEDLGTEAVYELTVKDFPCFVGIDIHGNSIYKNLEI